MPFSKHTTAGTSSTHPSIPQTFTDGLPLPKLLVFDLDYTLWPFWVDTHVSPPLSSDPAASPARSTALDATGQRLAFYRDVPAILHAARTAGIRVAAASRTHAPPLARDLLRLLHIHPPRTSTSTTAAATAAAAAAANKDAPAPEAAQHFFTTLQIFPGDKVRHFREIQRATGAAFGEMLFFDDEARNRNVERELGVLFVHVPRGVDRELVDHAVARWRGLRQGGAAGRT